MSGGWSFKGFVESVGEIAKEGYQKSKELVDKGIDTVTDPEFQKKVTDGIGNAVKNTKEGAALCYNQITDPETIAKIKEGSQVVLNKTKEGAQVVLDKSRDFSEAVYDKANDPELRKACQEKTDAFVAGTKEAASTVKYY